MSLVCNRCPNFENNKIVQDNQQIAEEQILPEFPGIHSPRWNNDNTGKLITL